MCGCIYHIWLLLSQTTKRTKPTERLKTFLTQLNFFFRIFIDKEQIYVESFLRFVLLQMNKPKKKQVTFQPVVFVIVEKNMSFDSDDADIDST